MEKIYQITLIGLFVGIVGTGLGGFVTIFFTSTNKKFLSCLLGLTSGIMLSIVTFDLLPESLNLGGIYIEALGIILGVILIIIIEKLVPQNTSKPLLKSGILLCLGIAIHNLPEGLAIGSSYMIENNMGFTLSLVILLHNLPEGLAMSTPLKISKISNKTIVFLSILAGVPTGIGAFIGAYLGQISDILTALCLSFAGGTMLYIICNELIPNAKALHSGRASTISLIIGFILGIIIIF